MLTLIFILSFMLLFLSLLLMGITMKAPVASYYVKKVHEKKIDTSLTNTSILQKPVRRDIGILNTKQSGNFIKDRMEPYIAPSQTPLLLEYGRSSAEN